MKQQNYKYDIALSFAEEDLIVAKNIAKELKRLHITYYLYTEEVTLTSNLTATTWDIYTQKSRFALVLISKHYKEKKWASREWDAIQTVYRPKGIPYIIPLQIDSTELTGLNPDVIFLKWNRDASHTAISLFEFMFLKSLKKNKVKKKKTKSKTKKSEGSSNKIKANKIRDINIDQSNK